MWDFYNYPDAYKLITITSLYGFYLALLGIPLILKKQAFTGAALAQAAAFGGALGAILHLPRFVLPFVCILGTLSLIIQRQSKRTPEDGPVAILFINAAAFSTLLISKMPTGEADLLIINFGNILALSTPELWSGIIISVAGIITFMYIYSPLLAVINDIESAKALGYRPYLILSIYTLMLTVGITFGLIIFGVIVVFGFLVTPAFLALRFADTRSGWLILILILAVLSGSGGLWLAFGFDFPPGPFIAGLLGLSAFISWLIRR
ncbi:metal ABC transporter permease [candidate division KSB1 bacterium]